MRMTPTLLRGAAAAALMAISAAAAQASLIGDDVDIELGTGLGPTFNTTVTVGPGVDATFSVFSWDIGASSVLFAIDPTPNSNLGVGIYSTVSDLDWSLSPTAILLDATIASASGTFATITDAALTVGDSFLTIDFSAFNNASIADGASALVELTFGEPPIVPLPPAIALLPAALGGLAMVRRRRATV